MKISAFLLSLALCASFTLSSLLGYSFGKVYGEGQRPVRSQGDTFQKTFDLLKQLMGDENLRGDFTTSPEGIAKSVKEAVQAVDLVKDFEDILESSPEAEDSVGEKKAAANGQTANLTPTERVEYLLNESLIDPNAPGTSGMQLAIKDPSLGAKAIEKYTNYLIKKKKIEAQLTHDNGHTTPVHIKLPKVQHLQGPDEFSTFADLLDNRLSNSSEKVEEEEKRLLSRYSEDSTKQNALISKVNMAIQQIS
eukprot:Nk52_evm91s1444 gene=Nk52_evmTU91s1444